MQKVDMREWVGSLEQIIDLKLKKWQKIPKLENGASVQLSWRWFQTAFLMDIFWQDQKELVVLSYRSPYIDHDYRFQGLNDKTLSKVIDRVGNLAQSAMYPPIDPEDKKDPNMEVI